MQIYTVIHSIDIDKLLVRIGSDKKPLGCLLSLVSLLPKAVTRFAMKPMLQHIVKRPTRIKSQIENLADEYGLSLSLLRVGDDKIIENMMEGAHMLNVSVSVDDIDYDKLVGIINESLLKRSYGDGEKNNMVVHDIIKIVKPFIGKTMATVPTSAIAELLNLLAIDKIVEMAGNYGVKLSKVAVKGSGK